MEINKKELCPECDEWIIPEIVEKEERVTVRKEEFIVRIKRAICTNCKKEFALGAPGFDEKVLAYDLYRKKHNYLLPEEIKRIREKYGLAQRAFSRLLGFGEITIHLYEKGALPDETHMEMIKLSDDPENIKRIYEDNKEAISESDRVAFEKKLYDLLAETKKNKLREVIEDAFNYEPDIYNGFKKFNLDYVVNIYKLILKFCKMLYTTHMVKILCYIDFIKFKQDNIAFTGCRYIIGEYGPFLDNYDKLFCYLVDTGVVDSALDYPGGGKVYYFKEEPDMTLFSEKDIKLIKKISEELGSLTPGKLSEKTHQEFPGWDKDKIGQFISFENAKNLKIDF
ncbi:MAG: DUF4065 domain-containing protein [Candidatus Goldbacteria bacterium]|nr:DUF4065 domain-containing protein [Candidatus Goldiibacteriota bacterium]